MIPLKLTSLLFSVALLSCISCSEQPNFEEQALKMPSGNSVQSSMGDIVTKDDIARVAEVYP